MNKHAAFGEYPLGHPATTRKIDAMTTAFEAIDAEDARRIAAHNEEIYVKAIRRWFRHGDANTVHGGER